MKMFTLLVLASLTLFSGCAVVPMSRQAWEKELSERRVFAKAGLEFKSRRQILTEAREMREAVASVTFGPSK